MFIGVSTRVDSISEYSEQRDALDQRWMHFFSQSEILPYLLPNCQQLLPRILKDIPFSGFLLTGGSSLARYGGNAPERDYVEQNILAYAIEKGLPVLGVCRGMQVIQDYFSNSLQPVSGHVNSKHQITFNGMSRVVNSYHELGAKNASAPLLVESKSDDGVLKAISHESLSITGIMWHPERQQPFEQEDIDLFKRVFHL